MTIGLYNTISNRLMSHRNLEYLHRNKIIYRRYPILDEPDQVFDWGEFYQDGTYECYDLFKSKNKKLINLSYSQLDVPGVPLPKMEDFLNKKQDWYESSVLTAVKIITSLSLLFFKFSTFISPLILNHPLPVL